MAKQKERRQRSAQMSFLFAGMHPLTDEQAFKLMGKNEKQVFSLLSVGKENALDSDYISKVTGLDTTTVGHIITRLRAKYHRDIGGARGLGYWRLKDPQEWFEYTNSKAAELKRATNTLSAMYSTPFAYRLYCPPAHSNGSEGPFDADTGPLLPNTEKDKEDNNE